MSFERLAVVAAIGVVVAVITMLYRTRRHARGGLRAHEPRVGADLTHGQLTWVVFTTPYCATCGPITDRITRLDPGTRLVTIDVADRPDLARLHDVRAAPTLLLADADGVVRARVVGDVDDARVVALAGRAHHDGGRHE